MKKRLSVRYIIAILVVIIIISIFACYNFAVSNIKVAINCGPAIDYPYSQNINNYMAIGYYIYNPTFIPIYIEDMEFAVDEGFIEEGKIISKYQYGFFVYNQLSDIEKIYNRYEHKSLNKFIILPRETKHVNICYKITNEKTTLPVEIIVKYKVLFLPMIKKIEIMQ